MAPCLSHLNSSPIMLAADSIVYAQYLAELWLLYMAAKLGLGRGDLGKDPSRTTTFAMPPPMPYIWPATASARSQSQCDSIQQLCAGASAAKTWHGLARHIRITIIVAELIKRSNVGQREEGHARQPGVVVTKNTLLKAVWLAGVIEKSTCTPRKRSRSEVPAVALDIHEPAHPLIVVPRTAAFGFVVADVLANVFAHEGALLDHVWTAHTPTFRKAPIPSCTPKDLQSKTRPKLHQSIGTPWPAVAQQTALVDGVNRVSGVTQPSALVIVKVVHAHGLPPAVSPFSCALNWADPWLSDGPTQQET
eukprot:scaffold7123_cov119-Isochrysis_galbana.AAC.4